MPRPEIRVFIDLDELSRQAAAEFISHAEQRLASSGSFSAALSGGSTPQRFCALLGSEGASLSWSRVHLFQVDERCVPPDDPRSNYRMLRQAMLDRLPEVRFHRMQGECPSPEDAAASYEAELCSALPAAPGEWPRLDVIYLGLGEDGHTASLFPETAALAEQRLAVCANFVPKLAMHRITLTFPVLNAASRVIFLVSGEDKAEIVERILSPRSNDLLPAARVQPAAGAPVWYIDRPAAGRLSL